MYSRQMLIWGVILLAVVLDIWVVLAWQKRSAKQSMHADLRRRIHHFWSNLSTWDAKLRPWLAFLIPKTVRRAMFLLVGIGLITYSLWVYHHTKINGRFFIHWFCLALGVAICIFMMPIKTQAQPLSESQTHHKSRLHRWQIACLVISPILAYSASVNAGFGLNMSRPTLAIACWLVGITLAILGRWPLGDRQWQLHLSKRTILLVVLLIAASLIIRGVNTAHIPIVFSGDEGSFGLFALEFTEGKTDNIFRAGWFSFPSLFFFFNLYLFVCLGKRPRPCAFFRPWQAR